MPNALWNKFKIVDASSEYAQSARGHSPSSVEARRKRVSAIMREVIASTKEMIGHWVIESCNGFRYMRIRCPICRVWIDGPIFVGDNGVHFLGTWPTEFSHEMVEIASEWKKRLSGKTEVPLENLHVHLTMFPLCVEPDWKYDGFVQYFLSGKPVVRFKNVLQGKYDSILIQIKPGSDESLEELEEIVLHELVHAGFPKAGRKSNAATAKEFFDDKGQERWVQKKTKELLEEYGYVVHANFPRRTGVPFVGWIKPGCDELRSC